MPILIGGNAGSLPQIPVVPPTIPSKISTQLSGLGQNIYWVALGSLVAGAAPVQIDLLFDFPFKLIAILVEHCDAAGALSANYLDWSFNIAPRNEFANTLPIVAYDDSVISQFYEIFGDDYVFPSGTYKFNYETTATDILKVVIIIQRRNTD